MSTSLAFQLLQNGSNLSEKGFFGQIPFPLVHCDTELEMDEVYEFRDRYAKEWGIRLMLPLLPIIRSDHGRC